MSNNIKWYEKYSLSNHDIFNILDGKFNLVLYPNLYKYRSIDEVLGPYGACVLLVEAKKGYGHWVCLWKLNNYTLSFFNSYGGYPDDALDSVSRQFAMMNHEDKPYLSHLMDISPYELTYNEYAYQQKGSDIRTCGRHVCVRLICRTMDDDYYHNYITFFCNKFGINADEFVTILTTNPPIDMIQQEELVFKPGELEIIEV